MLNNTLKNTLWKGLGASLLGIALVGCGSNGGETAPAPTTTTTSTDMVAPTTAPATKAGTGATSATAASFTAAAATWTKITAAKADLDKVIASKNLKTVHEAAFKVRDIVKTLPAQSSALAPDKAKTLASQVKNVEQLAGKLDEAGDSNNLKETQENQAGLNDTLDTIHDLYPSGTFK